MTETIHVTTDVVEGARDGIIEQIQALVKTEPSISPRSDRQLRRSLAKGRLVVALDDDRVVGWFLAEGRASGVPELGFLFVVREHRNGELFRSMLDLLLTDDLPAVAVTFQPGFALWAQRTFGFRESSLAEVIWLTRGAFLARRMMPARIRAVRAHTSKARPLYLVHEGRS
ncbi:hypothetical protein G7066_02455 [Leucobacter coleopterorum]|uniref:N-acetyltransferase domain-containing protein n=1 Tax=Leucobacter coleopterorum TaxID=2714933 RepID=A0ABX6JU89_9MICO|nr:hypothetical protein [Leucobacter coleopterorum]QIM17837.1 hypothetical protein G7066_02455 [Leucobacter coleopterorum]